MGQPSRLPSMTIRRPCENRARGEQNTMNEKKKRPPALVAFLPIGIAFIAIGMGGNSAFIPIGCAFIVIGIAGVARHRKTEPDSPPGDETRQS